MITSLNYISTQSESDCSEHLAPISYVLVTWGISSLGASCPPLSDIFVIRSSFEHILTLSDFELVEQVEGQIQPPGS